MPKIKNRRSRAFCIFAFGAKKMKGINRRTIDSALGSLFEDRDGERVSDLSYVVMGNVRETEKVLYALCRKHHYPIAVVPSDFEKFNINAEGLRNGVALKFFKPTKVIMAYPSEEAIEEDGPGRMIVSWAKRQNIDVTFTFKKEKKNAR